MLLEKPWGIIKEYTLNQVCSVRMIVVSPGERTSLHYHRLRDDMWVILDRGLEVQVGDRVYQPREGDEFVIKAGTVHRIEAGGTPGRVLEINFGFSSEDDVYRTKDRDAAEGRGEQP